MLVLKRKIGEEIRINSDITVKVLSVSDGQVKIGVIAPKEVEIYRGELFSNVRSKVIEASQKSQGEVKDLNKLKVNKIRKG